MAARHQAAAAEWWLAAFLEKFPYQAVSVERCQVVAVKQCQGITNKLCHGTVVGRRQWVVAWQRRV